jgi:hypothetical protein
MRFPHSALVLWTIRDRKWITWSELFDYFGVSRFSSGPSQLSRTVKNLIDAQLLEITGGPDRGKSPSSPRDANILGLTARAQKILDVLDLSLTELAKFPPNDRMIVSPALRRTEGTQYESDILVFMPFSDALRPVYDDHLKAVATSLGWQQFARGHRLGGSDGWARLARADSGFTTLRSSPFPRAS